MNNYLSLTEFANITGYTRQNIHLHIQSGRIKAVRMGNVWAIPCSQLDGFKKKKERGVQNES